MIITNTKPTNIQQLKEMAFRLPADGVIVTYPYFVGDSKIMPTYKMNTYNSNNGVLFFIDENYVEYVIPLLRGFISILKDNGYVLFDLSVPFSKGDFPKYNKEAWENLVNICKKLDWEDTRNEATALARKFGIKRLPKEVKSKAKEIPVNGIKVILRGKEDTIYPLISTTSIDSKSAKKIGTFYTKNNTVVIHSDDAKTYSLKYFNGLYDLLTKSGYREVAQYVPFSNGEEII